MSKITRENLIQLLKIGSTFALPIEIDITESIRQRLDDNTMELIKCAHGNCSKNPDFKLRIVLHLKMNGNKLITNLEVTDRQICDSKCRIFRNGKLE